MTIVNSWDQCVRAGGDRIGISYYAARSRSVMPAHWRVWRLVDGKEVKTDPKAAWYDNGCKTFLLRLGTTHKERKAHALRDAVEWVKDRYGERDFVKNRLGDYVEREVNERFPIPKERKNDSRAAV